MKYIDTETWERKAHFEFFYRADYPQFNVCMNLDISKFISFVKEKELPFYFAMMFAVMKTVNTIADFRYRIRSGKVVLHDKVHPSFTYLNSKEQSGLFKLVIVDMLTIFLISRLTRGRLPGTRRSISRPKPSPAGTT
jgi:chloramphenicol O-acetyltransferase type A